MAGRPPLTNPDDGHTPKSVSFLNATLADFYRYCPGESLTDVCQDALAEHVAASKGTSIAALQKRQMEVLAHQQELADEMARINEQMQKLQTTEDKKMADKTNNLVANINRFLDRFEPKGVGSSYSVFTERSMAGILSEFSEVPRDELMATLDKCMGERFGRKSKIYGDYQNALKTFQTSG